MTENPTEKPNVPLPDPATDCCLYRSLRYNLMTARPIERGADLYARWQPDGQPLYYFRHWTWCDAFSPGIIQITSREEAAYFIREQFKEPGLFSSWNHKGIYEFLPEVYGKESGSGCSG